MHRMAEIIKSVDKTHKRLGNMTAVNILGALAGKCVLNVAVAGTGKSTATNTVKQLFKDNVITFDSITRNGLKYYQKELNGFRGVVIIDDIGKIDTEYTRITTITTMAELTYSHEVKKSTNQIHLDISGFHGSALMNVQPVVMPRVVKRTDWDANIRDKTIRYYHLYRATEPTLTLPKVKLDSDIDITSVRPVKQDDPRLRALMAEYKGLWSKARALQHLRDLVRALAAVDGRKRVKDEDFALLAKILTPLKVEKYLLIKQDLEGKKTFRHNYMCLLTEFISYDVVTIDTICDNYGVSKATAYRILNIYHNEVLITPDKGQRVILPTPSMKKIIDEVDIYKGGGACG